MSGFSLASETAFRSSSTGSGPMSRINAAHASLQAVKADLARGALTQDSRSEHPANSGRMTEPN